MYDIDTILATIERMLGKNINKARLIEELERGAVWVPELDRMIAVADNVADLAGSNRYGLFEGMSDAQEYQISTGRYKYARLLTAVEIAKCY